MGSGLKESGEEGSVEQAGEVIGESNSAQAEGNQGDHEDEEAGDAGDGVEERLALEERSE